MANEIILNNNKYEPYWNGEKIKEIWMNNKKVWGSSNELWIGSDGRTLYTTKDLTTVKTNNDLELNLKLNGRRGIYFFNDYYFIFNDNGDVNRRDTRSVTLKRTKDGITFDDITTLNDIILYNSINMYYVNGYLVYIYWKVLNSNIYINYTKNGTDWYQYVLTLKGLYEYEYSHGSDISICYFKNVYYISVSYRNGSNNINSAVYKCTNSIPNNFTLWTEITNVNRPGCTIFCNKDYLYWSYNKDYCVKVARFNNPEFSTTITELKTFNTVSFSNGDGDIYGINGLVAILDKYAYCSYIQHGNNSNFVYYYRINMENGEVIRVNNSGIKYDMAKKDGYYYYVPNDSTQLIKTLDGITTTVVNTSDDYSIGHFNTALAYSEPNMIYA